MVDMLSLDTFAGFWLNARDSSHNLLGLSENEACFSRSFEFLEMGNSSK